MATPSTRTVDTTTLALKEWGAVVHALLDGRQSVLLRKGGIHERSFDVALAQGPEPFVLFPTVAHSHAERVRPEHRDLLEAGAADVTGTALTVRAGIRLVDAIAVRRPDALGLLADLHIWTLDSVREDRLAFRPRHPLHVLVVQPVRLPAPVVLTRHEEFGGCRSWLRLPLDWDGASGEPVHDEARLAAIARRVRSTVT